MHTPLTKPRFVVKVRAALERVGVSGTGYSGHSFRSGAATAAAQAGIEDSSIQALGIGGTATLSSGTLRRRGRTWQDFLDRWLPAVNR